MFKVLLANFIEPRICLLFGLSSSGAVHSGGWSSNTSKNAFLLSSGVHTDVIREIPLAGVETIVNCLLDIIKFGTEDPGKLPLF